MATTKTQAVRSSLIVPGFLVIFTAIAFGIFFHAFLHPELYPLKDSHLMIGTTTAVLSIILIMTLFLRTQQLSAKLKATELLQAKEDLEKTFNTMTDFVSVHDKDFKIIKVNNSLCEFLGKSPEEILGKLCYQIFHNLDQPYENCPHKKAAAIGHPVTEIISDPNLGVPLQITCSPLFNEDSTFQGSVHMARVREQTDTMRNKGEIIPICASCKSIRKNENNWITPEDYFVKKYDLQFTHTLCKGCQKKLYPDFT